VNVYLERKSLAHSLNDTKTAIEELNRLVSVIVLIVDIIVCLLLMGFLTTQILVFISSQLLLVVFLFDNTAKTVFEAIIFVFVMHPFDVGDRCVVDGVQVTP
jgi:small-conductance mechanosensitive channel